MRLLVVMASCPFPPRVGSAIVACNSIRELAGRHWVQLLCLDGAGEGADFPLPAAQVEFIGRPPRGRFTRLLRYAFHTLRGIPAFEIVSMSDRMKRRVRELTTENHFDAILLFEMGAIQYVDEADYGKVIANVEDPLSIKHRRMSRLALWNPWQKLKLYVNEKLAGRFEARVFPKLGMVLLLSGADLCDMREAAGYGNLGCVAYGVTLPPLTDVAGFAERSAGTIVYSGSMFHPPNVDGALFFLQRIFPGVLEGFPEATLWIVGARPDRRILRAAAPYGRHVVITGRVDDMAAYLGRAKVAICPVRLKIGVQTKILEALAWGTPVVTTSAGNSGIGASSGRELWVEDEPDRFAGRVVDLLGGKQWEQLSGSGRRFVEGHFSWQRSAAELERHIAALCPGAVH